MTKKEKEAKKIADKIIADKKKADKKKADKLAKDLKAKADEDAKEPKFEIGSLGYLGGIAVLSINEKVIDHKKYNNVVLINGVGYMLSDKDLKKQVKKEA